MIHSSVPGIRRIEWWPVPRMPRSSIRESRTPRSVQGPLEVEDGQVTLPPYSLTVVELEG